MSLNNKLTPTWCIMHILRDTHHTQTVAQNMKKLLVIIIILTLNSCIMFKENGIEMEIKNNSNEPITNAEFTTSEKLEVIKIDRIEPNESVNEFL